MAEGTDRKYTYQVADLKTGALLYDDVPLFGVYMEYNLSAVSQFNASLRLVSGKDARIVQNNKEWIDATTPGKRVVYVKENDTLLPNCYIIWTRTFQKVSKTFQITGQTLDSYNYRNLMRQSLEYKDASNYDQMFVYTDILTRSQQGAHTNLQIEVPSVGITGSPPTQVPNSGITRELLHYPAEFTTFGDCLEELIQYDNAPDVRYEAYVKSASPLVVGRRLQIAYPKLGRDIIASGLVLEEPAFDNYWYTESAAEGITDAWATGPDEGWDTNYAQATNTTKLTDGYPHLEQMWRFDGVVRPGPLQSKANNKLARNLVPKTHITVQVSPAFFPLWSLVQLGDAVRFAVTDERFPDGHEEDSRIIGWNMSVGSGAVPESIEIIIPGADNAAV